MEQQNTKALSDKAFARLALTSILGILVCIVSLCSTTYAWFTHGVQSSSNRIQAAEECLLSVSVVKDDAEEVVIDTQSPITLVCEGEYTVTLTLPKESASGYVVISVDGSEYYSDYLLRSEESDQTLTFTILVGNEKSVSFTARWGIHSHISDVVQGEQLVID